MRFGLTLERLAQSDSPVVIMHPGPINRVEISSEVADSSTPSSLIRSKMASPFGWRCCLLAQRRAELASLAVLYLARTIQHEVYRTPRPRRHRDETVEKLDALHAPI